MNKPSHFLISAGKTLKFTAKQVSVVCNEGTAWVTSPGDQTDYIIRSGERLNIKVKSRRAPVVIGSLRGHAELDVFTA